MPKWGSTKNTKYFNDQNYLLNHKKREKKCEQILYQNQKSGKKNTNFTKQFGRKSLTQQESKLHDAI